MLIADGFVPDGGGFAPALGRRRRTPRLGFLWGQSNELEANYNVTGGSDSGYGISDTVGYAPCLINQYFAHAAANPQTWTDTGTVTLRAYAPAGQANMGPEQTLGRDLVQYRTCVDPILVKVAIGGTRLPFHWMKAATFPTAGNNLYSQMIARLRARQIEFGIPYEYMVLDQGESDTGTLSDATDRESNVRTFVGDIRTDLNAPGLVVFVCQIHPDNGGAYLDLVRAGNVAYVASDPRSRLLVFDDLRLRSPPHYDAIAQFSRGSRLASAVRKFFFPSSTGNLGAGPCPWYQQADPGFTSLASPAVAKPDSGADVHVGDSEYLACSAYGPAVTITLTDAVGFVQVGTQVESVSAGQHHTFALFQRLVTAGALDSNGRMPAPSVDFGTSVLNVARIFCDRGPSPWVADPTGTPSTGVNNANNTALTIAGGSTTAPNSLVMFFLVTAGATNAVTSVSNPDLTDITVHWDSRYNPGSGTVGMAFATGRKAVAGAFGATTVVFAGAGINVGMAVPVAP